MYDVILVTDTAEPPQWTRGYGAHRLANHLRLNGYTTLVIDFASAMSFETWKSICKYAISENTKMLGFSTTWWPFRNPVTNEAIRELLKFGHEDQDYQPGLIEDFANGKSQRWINEARQYSSALKVLLGGPKVNNYLDAPADHFVVGFGETQTIDLLSQPDRIWPKVIQHDRTAAKCDWSWNESQTLYTEADFIKRKEYLTLETSRGCRFACKFCSYPLIGQKNMMNYMKSKDALYRELMDNYERWGVTDYRVADDTFNDSTAKLEYLLDVTRRLPFQIRTRAYVRLDVIAVDHSHISMLKELGICYAWVGIDSLHPTASKIIGKGMSADRRKETLLAMKKEWGRQTELICSYIIGLPGEPSTSVEKSFTWLTSVNSPVDKVEFIPLRLNPQQDDVFTERSEFDLNYKKYGYSIPNMKEFWNWEKDDGTDILDFHTANRLSYSLNKLFQERPERQLNVPRRIHVQDPNTEYFEPLLGYLRESNI